MSGQGPSLSSAKPHQPVLTGWFKGDDAQPCLVGSRCTTCGTYFFPKLLSHCRNPDCAGSNSGASTLVEAELSRKGKLWSYTNACYKPPEPFIAKEPFEPFAIAAVELDKERMVILGPVVDGVGVEALTVGMPMELVLEALSEDDKAVTMTWKWKPTGEPK